MWLLHVSGRVGFWGGRASPSCMHSHDTLSVLVPLSDTSWVLETWRLQDMECVSQPELQDPVWTSSQHPHTQRKEQEEP